MLNKQKLNEREGKSGGKTRYQHSCVNTLEGHKRSGVIVLGAPARITGNILFVRCKEPVKRVKKRFLFELKKTGGGRNFGGKDLGGLRAITKIREQYALTKGGVKGTKKCQGV